MLKRFFQDQSGQFSIILAVAATTLLSLAGMAIDISNQLRVKTELQNAVDAATMAGAALAYDGKPENEVKSAVRNLFKAQCPISECDPDRLAITLNSAMIDVESTGSSPTLLMGIFGVRSLEVKAKARVNLGGTGEHYEVHLVLDNTGSMNIVDGVAAINQMKPLFIPYAKFGFMEGCAFACHLGTDGAGADVLYNGKSGAEIARDNNIPMRQDRIHNEMIDQATRLLNSGQNIKVAVHSFTWGVTTMIQPTDNLARVRHAIDDIVNKSEGTQYEQAAPEIDRIVGASGTGTELNPKKIVVLMTDGVQQRLSDHKPALMPLEACDKMKKDGRELYVLNIAYPDLVMIGGYQGFGSGSAGVQPFYNQLEPQLKACATDASHYFRADYGVSIDKALEELTDRILASKPTNLFLSQ